MPLWYRINFHSFQGMNMVLCFTVCTVFHQQRLLCTHDGGSCMILTVLSLSGWGHKPQLLRNQVTTDSLQLHEGHKGATILTHSLSEGSVIGVWVCTGFIWLRIESSGQLLWTPYVRWMAGKFLNCWLP
jgi:hypothetical protein